MKKLFIVCSIVLAIAIIITNVTFATDETINIDDIIDGIESDDIPVDEEPTDEITEIPEETTEEPADELPEKPIEEEAEKPETESTAEDNKLPQTGVTENYVIMFSVLVFSIFAIYAFTRIKRYNVK